MVEKRSSVTGARGAAEEPARRPCNVSAPQQAPRLLQPAASQAQAAPAARATATEQGGERRNGALVVAVPGWNLVSP